MDGSAVHPAQIGKRLGRSQKVFQRAYLACGACRSAKAKCEASNADVATCVRCERQSLQCVFSPVRSTKLVRSRTGSKQQQRRDGQQRPAGGSARQVPPGTTIPNVSHHAQSSASSSLPPASNPPARGGGQDTLARGSPHEIAARRDFALPLPSSPPARPEETSRYGLEMELLQTVVSSSQDAVRLLFKAAAARPEEAIGDTSCNSRTHIHGEQSPPPPSVDGDPKEPPDEVLHLWGQSYFVRHGWLSARQAVAYIDFFYLNLSCLSLVTNTFYSRYENHGALVFEQHLLCSTLLMIASRYQPLLGSRTVGQTYHVHDLLWRHVQQLIQGLTFGDDMSSTSTRSGSLGSVEALLLLTEWHPRAVAFPPNTTSSCVAFATQAGNAAKPGSRWYEQLLGPAKRTDRMSWMVLGIASSLSHELGVYNDDGLVPGKQRLRRLLYLNVNQLALTLGCTSFLSPTITNTAGPTSTLTAPAEAPFQESEEVISLWIDLTGLLKMVRNTSFSGSGRLTRAASDGLLDHFQPLLDQWFSQFQNFKPPKSLTVAVDLLFVDYQYVRMYLSSVGIQALFADIRVDMDAKTTFYEILRRTVRSEFKYVQEVVDASSSILSKAVALRSSGVLRFCPARVFFRVVSACVFLLKALCLSAFRPEVFKSLNLLDQCTDALASLTAEDDSPWAGYAELIQRYARKLRLRLEAPDGPSSLASLRPDNMPTPEDSEVQRWDDDATVFDPSLGATDGWPVHPWDLWMPSASESQFDHLSSAILTSSQYDPDLLSSLGLV